MTSHDINSRSVDGIFKWAGFWKTVSEIYGLAPFCANKNVDKLLSKFHHDSFSVTRKQLGFFGLLFYVFCFGQFVLGICVRTENFCTFQLAEVHSFPCFARVGSKSCTAPCSGCTKCLDLDSTAHLQVKDTFSFLWGWREVGLWVC